MNFSMHSGWTVVSTIYQFHVSKARIWVAKFPTQLMILITNEVHPNRCMHVRFLCPASFIVFFALIVFLLPCLFADHIVKVFCSPHPLHLQYYKLAYYLVAFHCSLILATNFVFWLIVLPRSFSLSTSIVCNAWFQVDTILPVLFPILHVWRIVCIWFVHLWCK